MHTIQHHFTFDRPCAVQYTPITFRHIESGWGLERGQYGDWVEVARETCVVEAAPVARNYVERAMPTVLSGPQEDVFADVGWEGEQ